MTPTMHWELVWKWFFLVIIFACSFGPLIAAIILSHKLSDAKALLHDLAKQLPPHTFAPKPPAELWKRLQKWEEENG